MTIFPFHKSSGILTALAAFFLNIVAPQMGTAFTAEETLVSSPGVPMPDIEFDRASFQVAWENQNEWLLLANVSPVDGSFDLENAVRLDTGLTPLAGFQNGTGTANGPEWVFTAGSSQILYTKVLGHDRGDLEVYHAYKQNNQWITGPFADANLLPFGRKGYVPIGNTRLNDPAPEFCFYRDDPNGGVPNLAWRKLNSPIGGIVTTEPDGIVRRASSSSTELVYPGTAQDGSKQIFLFDTALQTNVQLTFTPAAKTDCWLFNVPELNNEQVLATRETREGKNTVIVIYRKVGSTWTAYNTVRPPSDYGDIDSPEPVIYNGQSYMVCVARAEKDKSLPSEVWLLGIRKDAPFARMVSANTEKSRQDPEYLVTPGALYIYYIEVGAGGVYRCKTGLGPSATNIINGTEGVDVIQGTAGNDYIVARGDEDILTGGAGVDQFVFERRGDKGDTIVDFQPGTDLINLVFLAYALGYEGSNPLADGYVSCVKRGEDTILRIDPDGKAGPKESYAYLAVKNIRPQALSNLSNFVF